MPAGEKRKLYSLLESVMLDYFNIYFSDLQEMPSINLVLIKEFISLNS